MAEFSMWGPEQSGERQAAVDQSALLSQALSQIQAAGAIQSQPADRALKEAHARLYGAEAEGKQLDVDIRKKLSARLQDATGSRTGETPSESLRRLGQLHLDAGAFEEGRKLVEAAALVDSRVAREDQQRASAANQRTQAQAHQLEFMGNVLGAVTDQPSLERAGMLMSQYVGGLQDPQQRAQAIQILKSIPAQYTPETAATLKQYSESSLKAGEKLRLDVREREAAVREQTAAMRETTASMREQLMRAQTDLADARREALERSGGAPPRGSRNQDVTEAAAFIKQQLGGAAPEGLGVAAPELSDRARQLMRTNGALSYSQALAQAYDPKDFETEKNSFLPDKTKYVASGMSAAKPLTLPASKKVEDLRVNHWYSDGKKAQKWTGTTWSDK